MRSHHGHKVAPIPPRSTFPLQMPRGPILWPNVRLAALVTLLIAGGLLCSMRWAWVAYVGLGLAVALTVLAVRSLRQQASAARIRLVRRGRLQ